MINKPEWLKAKGPLLFAANHPNSFLDGIILTTLLDENLYSLARGDAFQHKGFEKLLRWLHLLPVYRTSEGVENLSHNYTTFNACQEVFAKGGLVMIFSEGRCINEWHLRPLRKGTARLATSSWQRGIDVIVLPVGFNYNTFRNFGKNVVINFGEPLDKESIMQHASDGKLFSSFNGQLREQLEQLVFEIAPDDPSALKTKLYAPQPFWKKVLLAVPAITGFVLHVPLYLPIKMLTTKFFDNDHFDSVVVSLLMLLYPIYLFVFGIVGSLLFGWPVGLAILLFMPFCAWALIQVKDQLDN